MDRSGVFLGSALGQPLGTGAGGGSTTTPASKTYVNGTDFTAGTTTTLTLTSVPFNDACIEIDFDGISQHKTSWTRVSNVITFTSPIPLLTTEVEIHWLVVISAAYTGMNATVDVFSGTGAQLTYSLSGIPISSTVIDCYIGGIYQQKSTYSWNGVQSITFTEAPPIGTNNIEFRWMAASSSVNTPANGSIGPLQMAAATNGPNGSVFLDQYGNMPITDSA